MAMLDPKLAILDETDSGLDIDALRIVATGVTKLHTPQNATVVITHYQRLLDYIVPDVVHVPVSYTHLAGSVFGYRCKWNNLAMPVTTICTPTQKVKKATILLMTMLPLVPIFRMMRAPCDRNR